MMRIASSTSRTKGVKGSTTISLKGKNWIYCSDIQSRDLIELNKKTGIPLFELKHALDTKENPRIAEKQGYSIIILRDVYRTIKKKVTYPIEFIFTKNDMITLVAESCPAVDDVFEEFRKKKLTKDFDFIIYRITSEVIRDYEKALSKFDEEVDDLEDEVLEGKQEYAKRLVEIKKKILFIKKSISANKEVLNTIRDKKLKNLDFGEYIHDLHTEFDQINSTIDFLKDRLTFLTEIFVNSVSNRLNRTLKNLTVIASFFLPAMLISSVYGMNVLLPLGKHPEAFTILVVVMFISTILMFWYLKRKELT